MTPITLRSGRDGTLRGDYEAGNIHPEFVVLWVHGFGSHRGGEKAVAVREECARRGWSFAAFDFRGHGESSGTMPELRASRLLEDLAAIRHWLKDSRGHTRLGLAASSMGAFAAAWSVRKDPAGVAGCMFIAPAFEFLEKRWNHLSEAERSEWQRTNRLRVKTEWVETELEYGITEERDQFLVSDLMKGWTCPALILHGAADNVIPVSESLSFLQQANYPDIELHLFKSGDHRLTAFKEEIAAHMARFFSRWIRS